MAGGVVLHGAARSLPCLRRSAGLGYTLQAFRRRSVGGRGHDTARIYPGGGQLGSSVEVRSAGAAPLLGALEVGAIWCTGSALLA